MEMFDTLIGDGNVFSDGAAWIGLERDVSDSVAWTSGFTPVPPNTLYTNWYAGEPVGGASYACTGMSPEGFWVVYECHNTYSYFCSKY